VVGDVTTLEIDIGIDGIPLAESALEAWPISARCNNLCDKKPFCIGLFCGYGKPEVDEFLKDYICDVKDLLEHGIKREGKHFFVCIKRYICDAPGRSFVKRIKGHTGYSSCERCVQEGDYQDNRMRFDSFKSAPRTEESFINQTDAEHHIGISPLTCLPTKFLQMFVLEPMHLLYHGVHKRFIHFLTSKCKTQARLSAHQICKISEKLANLHEFKPCEFVRMPRAIECVGRWKATELRMFGLYLSIVVMKGIVAEEVYKLILILFVACRIVSCPEHVKQSEMVEYAEALFSTFVVHSCDKSVFGKKLSHIIFTVCSMFAKMLEHTMKILTSFQLFP